MPRRTPSQSNTFRERVSALTEDRLEDFTREDLDELRWLLAREPNLDEVRGASEVVFGALWLVVADPSYSGELTLADLEDRTPQSTADELVAKLLS